MVKHIIYISALQDSLRVLEYTPNHVANYQLLMEIGVNAISLVNRCWTLLQAANCSRNANEFADCYVYISYSANIVAKLSTFLVHSKAHTRPSRSSEK